MKVCPVCEVKQCCSGACHKPSECLVAARIRELSEEDATKIREGLHKLHVNLGHPGNQHLVRIPETWRSLGQGSRNGQGAGMCPMPISSTP